MIRWKGELCDGEVHMTARDYCDHKTRERHEAMRRVLQKLGNNPILTMEVQSAVRYAVFILDDNEFLTKRVNELKEQIENMKARK